MRKKIIPAFYRLKHKISFLLFSFFKTNEFQELLKTVDTQLLIWNEELVNLETGEQAKLNDFSAETIAVAAGSLVVKGKKSKHIALYLANEEFIATPYQLPEISSHSVASALSYQVNDLMPGYPGQLMLAVNHDESSKNNIALWVDKQRTELLFNAFQSQSIELTAIIPRIMLASFVNNDQTKNQIEYVREQDEKSLLQVTFNNQHLAQWSTITNSDKADEAYFQQWEKNLDTLNGITQIESIDYWNPVKKDNFERIRYSFFPDLARKNLKKYSRLKKGRLAIIAGIILAVLFSLPFINNTIRYNKYEKIYLDYKEKTQDVRQMRASVNQFEDNWGLFLEHPKSDSIAIISKLNKIIPKNSWLSVFELKGNEVKIEGNSPDAASILAVISNQAEFTQVAFNQRTRTERGKNEHFGISFRLKHIDMDAYQAKFLSGQQ